MGKEDGKKKRKEKKIERERREKKVRERKNLIEDTVREVKTARER